MAKPSNITLAPGIAVPLLDFATQGNAVLGIRDSGKSYTATGLGEKLLDAGIPWIAFDPIGVWKYLKVPGIGAGGRGYPVVVAGEGGDIPLHADTAGDLVRAAMKEGISLVIDLYSIHLSKADWRRIVETCLRTLLFENREHGPRHVFIEEAAEFCPQKLGPDTGRVYAEVEKLARMGGNAGLGFTLINQRAEEVNKAVLELCDCLFLHRQKGRNSLAALQKWLELVDAPKSRAVTVSLPLLDKGECWIWAPGTSEPVRVRIPEKRSFHPDRRAIATQKPRSGHANVLPFVERMTAHLAALATQKATAKTKPAAHDSTRALQARVAELTQQLANAAKPQIRTVAAVSAEDLAAAARLAASLEETAKSMQAAARELSASIATARLSQIAARPVLPASRAPHSAPACAPSQPVPRSSGALPKAERKILTALAQFGPCSKPRLAALTGYAVNGGGFNNALGALRSNGAIQGTDPIDPTADGISALGAFTPLPTGQALIDQWLGQLPKAERTIFAALTAIYPSAIAKDQLAADTGYQPTGGGFNNALGRLRTLELITRGNEIRASENLFVRAGE
jgi:hypothetical protein